MLAWALLAAMTSTTAQATIRVLPLDIKLVIESASHYYGVPYDTMIRIAYVESHFDARAHRVNSNGTEDVGMFQINTVNKAKCAQFDIDTFSGNAYCAAKLLKLALNSSKNKECPAARYHSKTPSLAAKYCLKMRAVDITRIMFKE